MKQRVDPVGCVVFGCGAAFVILVVGVVLVLARAVRQEVVASGPATSSAAGTSPILPVPTPPPATLAPSAPAVPAPAPTGDDAEPRTISRPIEVQDPRRVDIAALFPAAQALALELKPTAQFVGIVAERVGGGVVDLRPENIMAGVVVRYQFEYRDVPWDDPDVRSKQGSVLVTAKQGTWEATSTRGIAWKLSENDFLAGPLDPPVCTSTEAWEAAKLPAGRTGRAYYRNERANHPSVPNVWRFEVAEQVRVVNATTCAVVHDWQ